MTSFICNTVSKSELLKPKFIFEMTYTRFMTILVLVHITVCSSPIVKISVWDKVIEIDVGKFHVYRSSDITSQLLTNEDERKW